MNADEEKKRELYMAKLEYSVFKSLDALKHLTEEILILQHIEKVKLEKESTDGS